jgi:hypothetical protein
MNNKNNIMQTALEDYAYTQVVAKRKKMWTRLIWIGTISGYLISLSFSLPILPIGGALLVGILPGLMGAALLVTIYALTLPFTMRKKTVHNMLVALTEEQKKDILATYLEKKIKSEEENIIYYEGKIEGLQKSTDLSQEILKSLKEELTDLKA